MATCMVGWAHTKFGRLEQDVEALITEVTAGALADAGVDASEIDSVFLSTHNGGFVRQEFPGSLVMQSEPKLRFKPVTRVENACEGGSAAVHLGVQAIAAGARHVLVVGVGVGVEKMTGVDAARAQSILAAGSYLKEEDGTAGGFTGLFARLTDEYFDSYGDKSDARARIAAKNHRNGAANPLAHMQRDLGYDFCAAVSERNPIIAGRIRRTDCSMVTDGAAAVVLASDDAARTLAKAVRFRAAAHVNDFLPMGRRDVLAFEGPALAWRQAFAASGTILDDLDMVETHDCFTIAELMQYEAMGLTARGDGSRAIDEGWTEKGGRLPVNASGGLKAKGHPIGATGVSMHVMAAMQLTGEAAAMQINGAAMAGIFNMGGMAVANYASILEAAR